MPVLGVCWYPVISAPDWYDPTTLFEGGRRDAAPRGRRLTRVPFQPIRAVREKQERLGERPATEATATAASALELEAKPELQPEPQPKRTPEAGVEALPAEAIEVHQVRRRKTPESVGTSPAHLGRGSQRVRLLPLRTGPRGRHSLIRGCRDRPDHAGGHADALRLGSHGADRGVGRLRAARAALRPAQPGQDRGHRYPGDQPVPVERGYIHAVESRRPGRRKRRAPRASPPA